MDYIREAEICMKDYTLEVCVDSVESALEAVKGGADRLELCSNLVVGGTSPSPALFEEIRKFTDIKINVLIRPRFGDFCYSKYEFNIMEREIETFKKLGVNGVVIGILNTDGSLDTKRMKELLELSKGLSITLHRAFDVCNEPMKVLKQAKELGIHTILTSGQKNTCTEGKELIKDLVACSHGDIEILLGASVGAQNIKELYEFTKAKSYHMSGKIVKDSTMIYRKEGVSMGLPSFSEYEIFQTKAENIAEAKRILEEI